METVEILALSALVLSLLLLLKVFSLQRQLNEIKFELQSPHLRRDKSEFSKPLHQTSPSSPDLARVSPQANIDDRLRMLIASSKRIQAIKEFREVSGSGLKEAKDYVDHLERSDY
ncbi:ribosomal protein L7/L12 [Paenibacillus paridis]|uniref:ribosomal protein L7/L12 n=1 Tax=Paenibacillus paridis TaxID=2583376 RepID=UPI001391C08B|nr:ribosomal protein L7/L12 [Paenibacillus paridis]